MKNNIVTYFGISFLVLLFLIEFMVKYEPTPNYLIIDKWIEPTTIVKNVYEFDINGTLHLVKYVMLDKRDYVLKIKGKEVYLNYVDSVTWFNARMYTGFKRDFPKYDKSIYPLKRPGN